MAVSSKNLFGWSVGHLPPAEAEAISEDESLSSASESESDELQIRTPRARQAIRRVARPLTRECARAKALCIQGDFTRAICVLDRVLACDPTHIGALLGTGDTRRLQGELDQAMELYDKALEINPHCVHVLASMSALRHDMEKRRQQAEKELLDILEAEEEHAKQRKNKRERKKKRRNEKRQAHMQVGQTLPKNLTAAFDAAGTKMTAAERVAAFEAAGGMESVFGLAEDGASTSGEDDQPLCFETLLEQMKIEEQNPTSALNHAAYNTSSEVFSVAWAC